jgi:hypothetical protein
MVMEKYLRSSIGSMRILLKVIPGTVRARWGPRMLHLARIRCSVTTDKAARENAGEVSDQVAVCSGLSYSTCAASRVSQ